MTDPYRSASRSPKPMTVTVEADFHLEITRGSEFEARHAVGVLEVALFDRGYSVTVTGGPRVKRDVKHKMRRGLQ